MTVVIITPWEEEKLQKEQPSERCLIYTKIWSQCESRSVVSNSLWTHGLYSTQNSPDQNTGAGSFSLLQGIFPTHGLNLGLPHYRWNLYQLSHKGSPLEWVAYPFSRASSHPRDWTQVSHIAGGFFTNWAIRERLPSSLIDTEKLSICLEAS